MLWDVLDGSNGYYVIKMEKAYRSRVNCIFRIKCPVNGMPDLEKKLQAEALKLKITNIAGHTVNPGIRVSMYNAMPIDGVVALCNFLVKFMKENPVLGVQPTNEPENPNLKAFLKLNAGSTIKKIDLPQQQVESNFSTMSEACYNEALKSVHKIAKL